MHKPVDGAEALAREVLAQTLESHQLNSSAYYVRDSQGIRLTGVIAMEAMLAHSAALVAENERLAKVLLDIQRAARFAAALSDQEDVEPWLMVEERARTALETRNG